MEINCNHTLFYVPDEYKNKIIPLFIWNKEKTDVIRVREYTVCSKCHTLFMEHPVTKEIYKHGSLSNRNCGE